MRAVHAARVELASIGQTISASGRLVAREEAAVGAEVGGYRVLRVLAEAGDTVRSGEVLAMLDGELLASDAARARAALASADIQLERARSEAARVQGLDGTGALADEAILARRFEVRAAEARMREARAGFGDVARRQARLQLRAPVGGTVIARALRPGDIALSGSEPLFRIARAGLIELEAELTEADLARIDRGGAAVVRLPSGKTLKGDVRLLAPEIDASTRLGRVRVRLPRDAELRVGGSATAVLTGAAHPLPTVPEGAVQYAAGATYLLALDDRDYVRRVDVRLGRRGDGRVELISGPSLGTRVVLNGTGIVTSGDRVRAVIPSERLVR